MCGILGAVGNFEKSEFKNSLDLLKHRGPDADGLYFDEKEKIYLGHRRLSILDLSESGNQPMISKNGDFIIVFNGEVYNYKELKLKYKIKTKSNTDTEVLLNLYKLLKEKMLYELNGMFAFAIYDKKIFIARDRLGIKPIYFLHNSKEFIFSSEIKSIKKLYSKGLTFDEDSIFEYIVLNWIMEPDTLYKEIKILESGNFAVFDVENKILKISKYWDPKDYVYSKEIIKENILVEELEELFIDSINKRLISDVPVGSFLSGGIDSNFITEIVRKNKRTLTTLTVRFKERYLKESNVENDEYYARKYIDNKKINNVIFEDIEIDDGIKLFEKLLNDLEVPMGDPAIVPMYLLSKKARENKLIVILSGMGGDELFGGYSRMRFGKYLKYKKIFQIISFLGLDILKSKKREETLVKLITFLVENFHIHMLICLDIYPLHLWMKKS